MKSYLRRDNQACSSSIRLNQKTEKGTKTDEKSETQKAHNVRRQRQGPAFRKGPDNYGWGRGRLRLRRPFHQNASLTEGDDVYFWSGASCCLPSLCIKTAGWHDGGRKRGPAICHAMLLPKSEMHRNEVDTGGNKRGRFTELPSLTRHSSTGLQRSAPFSPASRWHHPEWPGWN